LSFTSYASPEFWALYHSLPEQVQQLARKQYELFAQNPLHPSLHLKQVGAFWSVRISRSYRALAGEAIVAGYARRADCFELVLEEAIVPNRAGDEHPLCDQPAGYPA
jgi:hypothetical protein